MGFIEFPRPTHLPAELPRCHTLQSVSLPISHPPRHRVGVPPCGHAARVRRTRLRGVDPMKSPSRGLVVSDAIRSMLSWASLNWSHGGQRPSFLDVVRQDGRRPAARDTTNRVHALPFETRGWCVATPTAVWRCRREGFPWPPEGAHRSPTRRTPTPRGCAEHHGAPWSSTADSSAALRSSHSLPLGSPHRLPDLRRATGPAMPRATPSPSRRPEWRGRGTSGTHGDLLLHSGRGNRVHIRGRIPESDPSTAIKSRSRSSWCPLVGLSGCSRRGLLHPSRQQPAKPRGSPVRAAVPAEPSWVRAFRSWLSPDPRIRSDGPVSTPCVVETARTFRRLHGCEDALPPVRHRGVPASSPPLSLRSRSKETQVKSR